MRAVSDTSPLFNLAAIDQLHLLHSFEQILIPEAVLHELEPVHEHPGVQAIHQAITQGWIVVRTVKDRGRVNTLEQDLGYGESEAITLALEQGLRRILIDEREGRQMAEQCGLEPLGVLGVLLRAKREGHLVSVKEMMIALRDEVGFYIHRDLFLKILQLAGED
jgi:predicted nucleic acid-binding protein